MPEPGEHDDQALPPDGGEAVGPVAGSPATPPARPSPRPWKVGERVRLRKAHPCGTSDWRITRVGADIGIACLGCGRRVMLPRDEFNRRVRQALDGPPGR